MNLRANHAAIYANSLLVDLGEAARVSDDNVSKECDHPALSWRRSGLLKTTGLMLPIPLASAADGALLVLKAISSKASNLPQYGSQIVGERARLRETVRVGKFCAGGYGRLLQAEDGFIALNLVREDDWVLIPAWLEDYVEDWDGIERAVRVKSKTYLTERAAEIGLAVSVDKLPDRPKQWFHKREFTKGDIPETPLIVDLSGLWAGPLSTSLLSMTGARVIKVEGPNRPDGMRNGHKGFYDLLNAGKDCAALDFKNIEDLARLKALLHKADVVIEASRPRALLQLGIIAEEFMAAKAGKIWVRLTAYGQDENRIGFGDDIGIAAGLARVMDMAHGEPCFVGDAIADPINGLHLALAVRSALNQGGGALLDFSMRDVLRYAMGDIPQNLRETAKEWQAIANKDDAPFYAMRQPQGRVKILGEDTQNVVSELC